ncbi:MAG: LysM peptidoglycan-binding domain-containing protein [Bacteroidetes bacterium]|nr:LysM peptidoglycan-binding domain-containing protein [Bacteroidota bacterium]
MLLPAVAQDGDGRIPDRPGDTLFSLAQANGVSVADLWAWNELRDSNIRAGMRLRIRPVPPTEGARAVQDDGSPVSDTTSDEGLPPVVQLLSGARVAVMVREGESMAQLADRYDLTPDSLRAWNPGLPEPLEAGMAVVIPGEQVVRTHAVRRGETLFAIARQYGTTVERLRALNPGLDASALRVGQQVAVPASDTPSRGATPLKAAGSYAMREFPLGMVGREVWAGGEYDPEAFQVSHPDLPPGALVLVQAGSGAHAFAEVVEPAAERRPMFVEGSAALVRALEIRPSEPVSFRLVR